MHPKMLNYLGLLYSDLGGSNDARDALREALNRYTALKYPLGRAEALANLGLVGVAQGREAPALAQLRKAQALYQQMGVKTLKAQQVSTEIERLTKLSEPLRFD